MKVLCHLAFSPLTPSSIETAKQKLEKDRLRREADLKIAAKQKKLAVIVKLQPRRFAVIAQETPENISLILQNNN